MTFAYLIGARRAPAPIVLDERVVPRPTYSLAVSEAPRTLEELRQRIVAILAREGAHGAAIGLVGRDGPIWIGGVGVRDRETGVPMDGATVFRVGSLSKSIIALGVMRLVDQGRLDLDRPLREIVDAGIENPWEDVAPVTLAQCLEHTAGLDDVRFNEIFTDDEALSVRDTLALNPRSRKIRWRPGTRHAYSNVGYTIAARAIEVASGEPFDAYLRREIMEPLGFRDADFRRTGALAARLATGYLERDRAAVFQPFAHRPAGALLASATDLAGLLHFWIRRGEGYPPIVSRAGLARIERNGTLPFPRLDADYGLASYGDVSHPVISRGHDGGMPGFHSSLRYFPELDVGYVLLLNSLYTFRGYFEIRALLFSYLTQGRAFPPPPPPPHAVSDGRPGAGYFAFASPRNALFGFVDRARLGWRALERPGGVRLEELNGGADDLVPTRDGGYRLAHESGSSVRFATNGDGMPVLLNGFMYAEAAPWWPAWARNAALSIAFFLLGIAPLWAAIVLGLGVLQRRRVLPLGLVLGPAVSGLCCTALPHVFREAFHHGVIGIVHPLTIALCALTLLLAASAAASLLSAARWWVRPDRPRLVSRAFPTICAIAAFGLTLWFAANGVIGLRTWAW